MQIAKLKNVIRGEVIEASDRQFDKASGELIWNGRKQSRRPKIIVKADDVTDVITAVKFAAQHGLRVSPRGGGHNFSGIAQQNGIVIDLGGLKNFTVNKDERLATLGPGVTNIQVAEVLEALDLAFPVGHCGSVPMSGYLLGGGVGWNSGAWGIAAASVESVDVVLADGRLIRASETENRDIFWAARGGGPEFFGIVVGYRVRLQRLPRGITTVVRVYPLDRIREIHAWMKSAMAVVPANVEFTTAMTSAPGSDGKVKVALAIATVFADNRDEAARVQDQIARLAPEGALGIEPEVSTPFSVLYRIIGNFFPVGHRYAVDSSWASHSSEDYLAGLADAVARAPSPHSFALGVTFPPGMIAPSRCAFSSFGPVWGCIYTVWDRPEDDAVNIKWMREAADRVEDHVVGHYVGEADLERPERRTHCHSADALRKLRKLQSIHDPDGMFLRPVPSSDLDTDNNPSARAA